MPPEIGGIPIVDLTAPTLLGLTVLLLLTGRIVPRATLVEKIKEAARWQEAYENERVARNTSESQTAELLELAKTTHHVITAVFQSTEPLRQPGGIDVMHPKE